jgi:6-pyruvoyltetrahydropterin/6-carboxytetrahydropterin synthase
MKTSIARRAVFSFGRRLFHPAWSDEANARVFGKSARPHGADCVLDVFYGGEINAQNGMIVNLADLKPVLAQAIAPLEGAFLPDDVAHFQSLRPTPENIASFVWQQLPPQIGDAKLMRVLISEGSRVRCEIETKHLMKITRFYEFAAAHRLHAPALSPQENSALFGKCNNPHGHGHNYQLAVTVEGEPDAQSGFIIAPQQLDQIVDEEVFERYDHRNLNEECDDFQNTVPTSENLARAIFAHLHERLQKDGYRLAKIGLNETRKNYFEVEA